MNGQDWTLEVSNKEGGEAGPLCPAKTFPAVVVGLIDLGTHQESDFKTGETYDSHKVAVIYELNAVEPSGKPYVFAESMPLSLHVKSRLYARYSAVCGAPHPGQMPNILAILGGQCAVEISHAKGSKGDRLFANVERVAGAIDGMPPIQPRNRPVAWRLGGGPLPDLSWAPKIFGSSIATIIERSHERRGQGRQQQPAPQQHQQPNTYVTADGQVVQAQPAQQFQQQPQQPQQPQQHQQYQQQTAPQTTLERSQPPQQHQGYQPQQQQPYNPPQVPAPQGQFASDGAHIPF